MSASSQYWETRNAAIRRFYGDIPGGQAGFTKLYLCNLWYNQDQDVCTPEEPANDSYAAISKHTQMTAMFGPQT